jgi:hypothetical protein
LNNTTNCHYAQTLPWSYGDFSANDNDNDNEEEEEEEEGCGIATSRHVDGYCVIL